MPAKDEMPATLKRSPANARRTWAKTHDSAVETFGGVDVLGNTRNALYERERALGAKGRSSMSKEELAEAIARKQ